MSRGDDIQRLITEHNRRLQRRKEQAAQYGIAVEPHIVNEIEDIEAKIADLQTELENLEKLSRRNPYRGLSIFREEDANFFCGRKTFTTQLVESVQQKPLVAVLGASGSGKSSIVFAGLIPSLRSEDWLIAAFRPGSDPFRALAAALLPLLEPTLGETDRLVETRKMIRALNQDDLMLSEVVTRIREKTPDADRLLLVTDQFEELYTLCPASSTRLHFLDTLLNLLPPSISQSPTTNNQPPASLVLTLRADFLGQALAYRPLTNALREADVKLGPMTPEELRQAIEKPAETQGVSFEAGLVERILDDVSHEPGHLPLLEFALTALWEQQQRGELTHTAYEAVGRVEGALSHHAEQVFERLNEAEQERARRVFVQMVRPGEGTVDTRRLATKIELGETEWNLIHWPLTKGILGRVAQTGELAWVNDISQNKDYVPKNHRARCLLVVPIKREDRVVDVIDLESTEPDYFTSDDVDFVKLLISHAAMAIENAQLFEQVREANQAKRNL